jgi:hypothetical protein
VQDSELVIYLIVFALTLVWILRQTWQNAGAGLILAYAFQLGMLYWAGALVHALPWADLQQDDMVLLGFRQCTFGIVAFAFGALVFGPKLLRGALAKRRTTGFVADLRLPRAYILSGIVFYFVLKPTLGQVKGFNAISAVGAQLAVVGCCLLAWKAWQAGGNKALIPVLAPMLVIPVVTIVTEGFLGFGVMALLTITMFCAQFVRPRWVLITGFLVSAYLGLCVYTTYMRGREELRVSVWGSDKLSDRVDKFLDIAGRVKLFDVFDNDDLAVVDDRLDQNILVGAAVDHLQWTNDYARGDTLVEALIGMVPRLIWPNKPMTAGSGLMVTRYTGIQFANGTSIGVGPVLELYANFATTGVVIGFLLLGIGIRLLDGLAGVCLADGDWHGFAKWGLIGISFLNVSGSFVETSMGAFASLILAFGVNRLLQQYKRAGPQEEEFEVEEEEADVSVR